jgi:hypothetical protein
MSSIPSIQAVRAGLNVGHKRAQDKKVLSCLNVTLMAVALSQRQAGPDSDALHVRFGTAESRNSPCLAAFDPVVPAGSAVEALQKSIVRAALRGRGVGQLANSALISLRYNQ